MRVPKIGEWKNQSQIVSFLHGRASLARTAKISRRTILICSSSFLRKHSKAQHGHLTVWEAPNEHEMMRIAWSCCVPSTEHTSKWRMPDESGNFVLSKRVKSEDEIFHIDAGTRSKRSVHMAKLRKADHWLTGYDIRRVAPSSI